MRWEHRTFANNAEPSVLLLLPLTQSITTVLLAFIHSYRQDSPLPGLHFIWFYPRSLHAPVEPRGDADNVHPHRLMMLQRRRSGGCSSQQFLTFLNSNNVKSYYLLLQLNVM